MPFSVYIAKPPADGGYGPHIYKVGKTTEEDVESRISALNDAGSNYPTSNGENWELVDHFEFANQEQMDTFETAMVANLGAGLDPKGTGATELFQSTTLNETFTRRHRRQPSHSSRTTSSMSSQSSTSQQNTA